MKKIYNTPSIKVLYLEELCNDFVAYSVVKSDGKTQDSRFDVHEDETPNGSDSWYDNSVNWGGD